MPRVSILPPSWQPNATGSSTNQLSDAPFRYLANPRPSYRWRSTNLTAVRGFLNGLAPNPWDTVALLYSNLTDEATWRITADNASANLWTTPNFDTEHMAFRLSDNLSSWVHWHSYYNTPELQTHQYVGIEIIDADNPAGYVEAGVLLVGELYTPLIGAEVGSTRGFNDSSVMIPLANSETIARRRPRKPGASFTFPFQDEPNALAWLDFARIYGNSTPVLVIEQPVNAIMRHSMLTYGYFSFARNRVLTSVSPYGHHTSSWEINEI